MNTNPKMRCSCGWEGVSDELTTVCVFNGTTEKPAEYESTCPCCDTPFDELEEVPLCVICEDIYTQEEGDTCGACLEAQIKILAQGCPRCGGVMRYRLATNALSRRDNETYICSPCGTLEAVEDFGTEKYDGPVYWRAKIVKLAPTLS